MLALNSPEVVERLRQHFVATTANTLSPVLDPKGGTDPETKSLWEKLEVQVPAGGRGDLDKRGVIQQGNLVFTPEGRLLAHGFASKVLPVLQEGLQAWEAARGAREPAPKIAADRPNPPADDRPPTGLKLRLVSRWLEPIPQGEGNGCFDRVDIAAHAYLDLTEAQARDLSPPARAKAAHEIPESFLKPLLRHFTPVQGRDLWPAKAVGAARMTLSPVGNAEGLLRFEIGGHFALETRDEDERASLTEGQWGGSLSIDEKTGRLAHLEAVALATFQGHLSNRASSRQPRRIGFVLQISPRESWHPGP